MFSDLRTENRLTYKQPRGTLNALEYLCFKVSWTPYFIDNPFAAAL